jgi:hypothetical protein
LILVILPRITFPSFGRRDVWSCCVVEISLEMDICGLLPSVDTAVGGPSIDAKIVSGDEGRICVPCPELYFGSVPNG